MISFEMPESIQAQVEMARRVALDIMRPQARRYDNNEHEIPWEYVDVMWEASLYDRPGSGSSEEGAGEETSGPAAMALGASMALVHMVEQLSWGAAGIFLCTPGSVLGGAAIEATGTPEQKERFLARFHEGKPKWAAMAMTESHCGSDPAAIRTRAVRDGDHWVLDGEKIFVTNGHKSLIDSNGFVVVWATVDPSAGRAGIKPFVVEAGTPGIKVTKLERKMGIRASDTASLTLEHCRIPLQNLLGSSEAPEDSAGFKGAMTTFDATRPTVAASALGIARATIDLLKELLPAEGRAVSYVSPRNLRSAIERDILGMEAELRAAWLLTLKAVWLMSQRRPNTLEASMCKIKAGEVVTHITQKGVELMGPLGYSRRLLLEKWMRDAKINDLFEGTGQINRLIVARRILGYSSKELK